MKKKISKSYSDFQKFMEEAYFQFEVRNSKDKLIADNFLQFIRVFRKEFNVKTYSKDPQIISSMADEILLYSNKENKFVVAVKDIVNHKAPLSLNQQGLITNARNLLSAFFYKHAKKEWDFAEY